MTKKNIGNIVIIAIAALNIVLWLVFPLPDTLETNYALQFIGEVVASTVMILIAMTLVLAARPRFLEPYFGGLDQMWQTHKKVSMLAFLLLIVHFFSIPKTEELVNGKPIGMVAFLGMVFLVLLTVAPRVPLISRFLSLNYSKWRIAHKLLGVFFILGLVHYLLVGTISKQTVPGTYMLLWSSIGIIAFIYRQFFSRMFEPYREYVVEKVNQLNGTCEEISLKPKGKQKVDFKAGQFVYVYFKCRHLREPHPFTVSSSPQDDTLRLTVKASGDWTRYLVKNLTPDTTAAVHGGFGMFNYQDGGPEQVWIAGGIGITPFLSWVRDLNGQLDADVDFFYGVRGEADALFWDEFKAVNDAYNNFRAHLQYSSRAGHLSPEDIAEMSQGNIANKHIYMCGPIKMTEGFAQSFKEMGVPAGQIHYEEFNFR
jgi:predicted ferric reductase